ncbi:MAG: hypothetical protein JSW11_18270 [Candidatus Heimdallarchaeota archaeon]|nr:MAG: hypothetical protein JSW11_18270 [Candidatus Heimdallarchaeota archaeon]
MLINLNGSSEVQDLQLVINNTNQQLPIELSLKVLLGSTVEISLIDDSLLLIKGENCEIRMDITKAELLRLRSE